MVSAGIQPTLLLCDGAEKFSFLPTLPIVPQLSKCLKFEAVWGVLTDQII